jgi:hypothetical protein
MQQPDELTAAFLQARSGDYLSLLAWQAGIPLDRLLLDNTAAVRDLDAALEGTRLMLCNPKQGALRDVLKAFFAEVNVHCNLAVCAAALTADTIATAAVLAWDELPVTSVATFEQLLTF